MSTRGKAPRGRQDRGNGRRDNPRVVRRKPLPTLDSLDLDKVIGGVAAGEGGGGRKLQV